MKKNLFLITILITTAISFGCSRSQSVSTVYTTPAPIITNSNSNANQVGNTYPTYSTTTVRDWVYYYDVDIYGYPYYEEGHPKHRKGSRRWYPPGHPNFDVSYMSYESPILKVKKNLEDLPKYRFSYGAKTLEAVSKTTTSSSVAATKITYKNDPLVKRPTFSVSTSLTPDQKTTSPYPKKTSTTTYGSDDYYGSTSSSSTNRKSSTSYGSSSYPSSSSYSTSSSSSSRSSTTYQTPSYSSSSSSSRSRRKR